MTDAALDAQAGPARPSCATCLHLHTDCVTCAAYPLGIPQPILAGTVDHLVPRPGDGGVRYRPRDAAGEAASR